MPVTLNKTEYAQLLRNIAKWEENPTTACCPFNVRSNVIQPRCSETCVVLFPKLAEDPQSRPCPCFNGYTLQQEIDMLKDMIANGEIVEE